MAGEARHGMAEELSDLLEQVGVHPLEVRGGVMAALPEQFYPVASVVLDPSGAIRLAEILGVHPSDGDPESSLRAALAERDLPALITVRGDQVALSNLTAATVAELRNLLSST